MTTQTLILCGCGNRLPISVCSHPSMLCGSSYEQRRHGLHVQWIGKNSRGRFSLARLQNLKIRFSNRKQAIFWMENAEMKGGWVGPVGALPRTGKVMDVSKWVKRLNAKMGGLQRSWEVVDNRIKWIVLSIEKPYRNSVEQGLFLLDKIVGRRFFNGAEEDEALLLTLASCFSSTDSSNVGQFRWFPNDVPQVEQSSEIRSTDYKVSNQSETQEISGTGSTFSFIVGNASNFVKKASPFARYLGGSFVLFYVLCLFWGLCVLFSGRMQYDEKETVEKDLRLRRIRHMKSELNGDVERVHGVTNKPLATDSSGTPCENPILADDEAFRNRILQIRHLASQARLVEQQTTDQQTTDVQQPDSLQRDVVGESSLEKVDVLEYDIAPPVHLSSDQLENLEKQLDVVRTSSMDATNDSSKPEESSVSHIEESIGSSMINGDHLNQGCISDKPELKTSFSDLHCENDHKHNLGEISADTNDRAGSPINNHRRVKPRVIISVEEAMARRAARKGKIVYEDPLEKENSKPSELKWRSTKELKYERLDAEETLPQEKISARENNFKDLAQNARDSPVLDDVLTNGQLKGEERCKNSVHVKKEHVLFSRGSCKISNEQNEQQKTQIREGEGAAKDQTTRKTLGAPNNLDEDGAFEWMKDDMLREIVFKVRANEQAGKDPFFGLGPEEESLFYKGLAKKFQKEEAKVKNWIRERVDQLTHGEGQSLHEVEGEKEVQEVEEKAQNKESRSGLDENLRKPPPFGSNSSSKSAALPSELIHEHPLTTKAYPTKSSPPIITRSGGAVANVDPAKVSGPVISKSDIAANGSISSTENEWQHTKKWGKELQEKYERERDPETRSLMKLIGRDLDRWITKEELQEADNLLSKGPAGEKEYVRRNYERARAKIKQQQERFGAEAMINKYKEYKPKKEDELWWFDLQYVLCIGLQMTENDEIQGGLYSLDMSAGFRDDADKQKSKVHTIAFQDRQEAIKVSYILKSQPGEIPFSRVEIVPYKPKDLYYESKAQGFRVTVIGKGKLQILPGKTLEEIEARIIEIGTSSFWKEQFNERAIDINAVLREGIGYSRPSH